ncbi:MAG: hypothetical protein IIB99_12105 [Planctomycetes bacterium]|nr:hypothetical protein [Planctomycetota bacterium]MCH8212099.1 hypothetical protein [Planctomycetota bacterium]MCH8259255.1 hypothetical protein [Planctomycetota bacterium]
MTFPTPRRIIRTGLICATVAALAAMSPSSAAEGKRLGRHQHGDQPLHAQLCSNPVHEGMIVLYENNDFGGKVQVLNVHDQPRHKLLPVHGRVGSRTSSIQWNLPEGTIAILYGTSRSYPQRQYVIWGQGQDFRLSDNGFNDRLAAICLEGFNGPRHRRRDRDHDRDRE